MLRRAWVVVGIVLVVILAVFAALLPSLSSRGEKLDDLAVSAWPMYQHDARHTGRSPYLIPLHTPELLWKVDLTHFTCAAGGITASPANKLIINLCGNLRSFDPIRQETEWVVIPDSSSATPLISTEGEIFAGFGNMFTRVSPTGNIDWAGTLDGNYAFNSSAVFGLDGSVYFVHDGLWSFTPEGQFRWYIPYGDVYGFSHAAPAVGDDGTIYAGGNDAHLCAYTPAGGNPWCYSDSQFMRDNSPAIASDDTIYVAARCVLLAINPNGTLKWSFTADESSDGMCNIYSGMAIASDDSVYFHLSGEHILPTFYAVDSGGRFKWKLTLPTNPTTGLNDLMYTSIVIDRANNLLVCPSNSRCYAITPQGAIIWEFEFPVVDSVIRAGGLQPLFAADGLFFIVDNQTTLYAFADPDQYPLLASPTIDLYFDVEPNAPVFTTSVSVSSTISPITYSVAYTPTAWLSLSPSVGTTPSTFVVTMDPSSLPIGDYRAQITIKPASQPGKWLTIPVGLSVGTTRNYLPMTFADYQTPGRILYRSSWYDRIQYAAIDQDGKNRTTLATDLPISYDSKMIYSPDLQKVAFQHYTDNKYKIRILDTRNGQQLLEIESTGWNWWPTWSPDSSQLLFISTRDDQNGEIYRINLDGTGLTRLTFNAINEMGLYWSPNGNLVAVQVNWNRTYFMNPDGSNLQDAFPGRPYDVPLAWSPDGRYLLVNSTQGASIYKLWRYDSQTGEYINLDVLINSDSLASWSPDGKKIAFDYRPTPYMADIYIVDANGRNQLQIVHDNYEDYTPSWSPDGIWLAFTGRRTQIYDDPNWDIFVVRKDGAKFTQITHNLQGDTIPYWQDR